MCGIIGWININITQDKGFEFYRERLRHRGPDDYGVWKSTNKNVVLGHCRLSIIDLSKEGHQPKVMSHGRYIIVFNGEIYNYLEIRKKLERVGYFFKSSGDTEVVLASYIEWGERSLERFNGMFAFAIYDQGNNSQSPSLFIARDRVGKKPLYYAHHGKSFAFASELKSIPQNVRGSLNFNALNHYLALGYVPADLCILNDVKKLPPAHAARYDLKSGKFSKWCWWKLPEATLDATQNSGDYLAEQCWTLLNDSVKYRLRSDVPVGVFLSGGLDSSLVTAAAANSSSQAIKTFTMGIPGSSLDESSHAKLIADYFGTDHHILDLPKTSIDVIDELSPLIDEPLADSSIIPTYLVSKLTSQHVKVALGGDGGDELFGGYQHYQQTLRDMQRFGWLPQGLISKAAKYAERFPAGFKGRNRIASLKAGIDKSYIMGSPYFDVNLRRRILSNEVLSELGDKIDLPERYLLNLMGNSHDIVDSLTRTDFQSILPDDYLVKVDRASMANGLEVRTPFLDYRLVEYSFRNIPTSLKTTKSSRRCIQNLMAIKYLPSDFQLDRKQGFSVPMDDWLRKSSIGDTLNVLNKEIINKKEISMLISGLEQGRANGARLFALMMLSICQTNMNLT